MAADSAATPHPLVTMCSNGGGARNWATEIGFGFPVSHWRHLSGSCPRRVWHRSPFHRAPLSAQTGPISRPLLSACSADMYWIVSLDPGECPAPGTLRPYHRHLGRLNLVRAQLCARGKRHEWVAIIRYCQRLARKSAKPNPSIRHRYSGRQTLGRDVRSCARNLIR